MAAANRDPWCHAFDEAVTELGYEAAIHLPQFVSKLVTEEWRMNEVWGELKESEVAHQVTRREWRNAMLGRLAPKEPQQHLVTALERARQGLSVRAGSGACRSPFAHPACYADRLRRIRLTRTEDRNERVYHVLRVEHRGPIPRKQDRFAGAGLVPPRLGMHLPGPTGVDPLDDFLHQECRAAAHRLGDAYRLACHVTTERHALKLRLRAARRCGCGDSPRSVPGSRAAAGVGRPRLPGPGRGVSSGVHAALLVSGDFSGAAWSDEAYGEEAWCP